MVKANKKDIDDIKTFLHHAGVDLEWGYEASYGGHDEDDNKQHRKFLKEMESGERGRDIILMMLRGLCDKWN